MIVLAAILTLVLAPTIAIARFFARAEYGLRAGEQRVLGAWTELALTSVDWGTELSREAVHRSLGSHMSSMPRSMRTMLDLGLFLFDLAPFLTGISWRRYASLPLAKRRSVSARLEHSRLSQLAMLHDGIATLCVLAIAGQPQTLARVGVHRDELVLSSRAARERAVRART